MQKMSREEKYEYWRMVIDEFAKSDKSIREQCRANNIPFVLLLLFVKRAFVNYFRGVFGWISFC